jgi:hypothetical protein
MSCNDKHKQKKTMKILKTYFLCILAKSVDSVTNYQLFQPTFHLIHEQDINNIPLHYIQKHNHNNKWDSFAKKILVLESL